MKTIHQEIAQRISPLSIRTISTVDSTGFIAAADVLAETDVPYFDESLRDGFVISNNGDLAQGKRIFSIAGEIAAGASNPLPLKMGQAYRIFTGGKIPVGGSRVIPFEQCGEFTDKVEINGDYILLQKSFIKEKGSEMKAGEKILETGHRIEVSDQIKLSLAGIRQVQCWALPQVGCLCTGSELVVPGKSLSSGQKTSVNGLLLENVLPEFGCRVKKCEIVPDNRDRIDTLLETWRADAYDLLVTTGGMGPGKYDLVRDAFLEAGGAIFLDSLPMRPGKLILFGRLGKTIFIGLPGPPHAVRTLIYEIVGPILLMMQGAKNPWPASITAFFEQDFKVVKSDVMQLKDGVYSIVDGQCVVRLTKRLEAGNCFIVFAEGKASYKNGDKVEIHLLSGL